MPDKLEKDKPTVNVEEERQKLIAETAKISLEIEHMKVQAQQADLLKEQIRLENSKIEAEAREAVARARSVELDTDSRERQYAEILAGNKYNHIIRFNEEVTEGTVDAVMDRLNVWHRNDPGCDIEIVFNSPGGSLVSGMELFDYLNELKSPWVDSKGNSHPGHKITTGARGIAASMASVLLQAGDVRWMGRQTTALLHEGQQHISGRTGEVQDTQEWMKEMLHRIIDIYVSKCEQARDAGTATKPLKRTDFMKNIVQSRKEWFLNAQQCLDGGLIDEIRG